MLSHRRDARGSFEGTDRTAAKGDLAIDAVRAREAKELLGWSSASVYERYEQSRRIFRDASAKLVNEVLDQHAHGTGRILEIGSGIGELITMVPRYAGRIQQSDASAEAVLENRRRNPKSNIALASAYHLPYENGSFSSLVSFATFEVFGDLKKACSECARVLSPGGKFIHFLDIQPSATPNFERFRGSTKIPFPFAEMVDGYLTVTGLQLVERDDYHRAKFALHQGLIPAFDSYASEPETHYTLLHDTPNLSQLLNFMGRDIAKLAVDREIIRGVEAFAGQMQTAFDELGLVVIENGRREGSVMKKRTDVPVDLTKKNLVVNDIGASTFRYDPSLILRHDQVQICSRLLVTVVQKPET